MGTINAIFGSAFGATLGYLSIEISTVSCLMIGSILICLIIVLGFIALKALGNNENEMSYYRNEDLNLGENRGLIRRKIQE